MKFNGEQVSPKMVMRIVVSSLAGFLAGTTVNVILKKRGMS